MKTPPRLFAVAAAIIAGCFGTNSAAHAQPADEATLAVLARQTHFHGIAVDRADPSRIYLATHHGLYVTGADGKARRISRTRDDFMGFTAHPTDPSVLYASGHPARGGNLGFIGSEDGGRTWEKISDGLNGPVDFHQMDVSKADSRVIYGVYGSLQRSEDGGHTWQRIGPPPQDIIGLAASSKHPDTLYAATQHGLQRSTDAGRTWTPLSDRLATMVHVAHDGTVYAFMAGKGLVRAAENNLAWRLIASDFGEDFLLHFAVDPGNRQRLYAVTFNSRSHAQSVIASRDGGASWTKLEE